MEHEKLHLFRKQMQAKAKNLPEDYQADYHRRKQNPVNDYVANQYSGDIGVKALEAVRERIVGATSFQALVTSALRYCKTLSTSSYARELADLETQPESALVAHAGVMHAKSAACKTMSRLADAVFREASLPRKPVGKFRGENGLDIAEVIKQYKEENTP